MVSINYATREVCCKIVYYGPGLSGKTTNLQVVHQKVPQDTRGKLISLATEADRTLYFDFLPINIGSINGFAAKFQLYTVPGQVYYNATRKLVLRGVDGVVFVADAQADKLDDNLESLSNLRENLQEYGYDLDDLPIVIQYNKTDLPTAMAKEELETKLNTSSWPSFTAAAVNGVGVFDTLKAIMKLVLEKARSGGAKQASASGKIKTAEAPSASKSQAAVAESAEAVSAATVEEEKPVAEPAVAAQTETPTHSTQPVSASAAATATVEAPTREPATGTGGGGGSIFGSRPASTVRPRKQVGSGPTALGGSPMSSPSSGTPPAGGVSDSGKSVFGAPRAAEPQTPAPQISRQPAAPELGAAGSHTVNNTHDGQMSRRGAEAPAGELAGHDPLTGPAKEAPSKKRGFFKRLFGLK